MSDSLFIMLEAQRDVQREVGHDFATMTDETRCGYISTMVLACTDELHEALGEVGWKPWATSRHVNREEYMGEITDAWLFLMNLMHAVGMTAEELIEITAKKQDNAILRARDGYDGRATKCPTCKRAYDNDGVKCRPGDGFDNPFPYCGYSKGGYTITCDGCGQAVNDTSKCRPANAYQGIFAFCAAMDEYTGGPAALPDWATHCKACCRPLAEGGCVNPTTQGFGWCGNYKCGHSDNYGLMHPSHGKGKVRA